MDAPIAGTNVLTSQAIAAAPAVPLGPHVGVTHRTLWTDGTSMAGVLTVEAGRRLGTHDHRVNHHHMWVLEGSAVVLGETIGPGSYVHIPAHVVHDIDATATEGCTMFYLYLRPSA